MQPYPVEIDIPEGLVIDADEFINSIKLQFWSRLAKLSWRPFEEARTLFIVLLLRTMMNGENIARKETFLKEVPTSPDGIYKDKGWISWGDWLGTGTISLWHRMYRPFTEARTFVHKLNLKNWSEWIKYCKGELTEKGKKPEDIPAKPSDVYKNKGWISMGIGLVQVLLPLGLEITGLLRQARQFVHELKLSGVKEWRKYCRGKFPEKGELPKDIPYRPDLVYKNKGWINWGDWFGTGFVSTQRRQFRSFEKARQFARGLGLKGYAEWLKYYTGKLPEKGILPKNIPTNPHNIYKDTGWVNYEDWLGYETKTLFKDFWRQRYRSFVEARSFVRRLGLKSDGEWRKYCKRKLQRKGKKPEDIPASPYKTYKDDGWISMGDWLGTGTVATQLRK